MKSGTLTFHRTTNYGALLQTYALHKVLLSKGYDNEVIDYRSTVLENRYKRKSVLFYARPKQLAKVILQNAYIRDNHKNFKEFSEKYLKISTDVYFSDTISSVDVLYDHIIVGSDQVWNGECMGWDPVYMLDFASYGKKNSYAASFGFETVPPEREDWYRKYFESFSHVSLREESGKRIFDQLSKKASTVVLDPTLLLSQSDWYNLAREVSKQKKGRYILLYVLKETKSIMRIARELSKKMNIPVVYVNDRLFRIYGFDNRFYTSPCEWLNLFMNASFVVTNSFHGTAFSINMNIPFIVELLPPPSKVNSRIIDILTLFDCQDRIYNTLKKISFEMNFESINKILSSKRSESMNYIDSIFEEK